MQLSARLVVLLAINVPMVSHEYEVSLVVEGHYLTSLELWLLRRMYSTMGGWVVEHQSIVCDDDEESISVQQLYLLT